MPSEGRLEFANRDGVNHNVHGYARKNPGFNFSVLPDSTSRSFALRAEEAFEVREDLFPWMSAWVFVSATPHIALTDAEGRFEIAGLPPGRHSVQAWHELLGQLKVKSRARITAGETTSVTVPIPEKQVTRTLKKLRPIRPR